MIVIQLARITQLLSECTKHLHGSEDTALEGFSVRLIQDGEVYLGMIRIATLSTMQKTPTQLSPMVSTHICKELQKTCEAFAYEINQSLKHFVPA